MTESQRQNLTHTNSSEFPPCSRPSCDNTSFKIREGFPDYKDIRLVGVFEVFNCITKTSFHSKCPERSGLAQERGEDAHRKF